LGDKPGSSSRSPETRPTRLIAFTVGIAVIVIASLIIRPLIASLTWDGKIFRCDGRSFAEEGTPTDRRGSGLTQSSVVLTWEGQLITAFNGAVSTT
jgi:hypothetical protein